MEVKIEGLRGLTANLKRTSAEAGAGMRKGLQAAGLEIIAEAKQNLNANRTNNTGTLRASGKVQADKEGIDAGFFSKGSKKGYAAAVEYGRGPTIKADEDGITLRESLKAWVKRKLGGRAMKSAAVFTGQSVDKLVASVAFLIARKIHREGTKPQPFFTPAVKKVESKIKDIISRYVEEALK